MQVEEGLLEEPGQKVTGKVSHRVLGKIPALHNPSRHVEGLVAMATWTEVLAHVLAVPIAFDESCNQSVGGQQVKSEPQN